MALAESYAEYYGCGEPVVDGAATQIGYGDSIYAKVGETKIVAVTCNQILAGLTLRVVIEQKNKTDVATVADGNIDRSAMIATFSIPSNATTVERVLQWSIVRTDSSEVVASGLLFVTHDARVDA